MPPEVHLASKVDRQHRCDCYPENSGWLMMAADVTSRENMFTVAEAKAKWSGDDRTCVSEHVPAVRRIVAQEIRATMGCLAHSPS